MPVGEDEYRKYLSKVTKYALSLAIVWTLVVSTSSTWNYLHEQNEVLNTANVATRAEFSRDLLFRRWNASHGGIYVPVTESTPPNPYLSHLPDRDIKTTAGEKLTLINPAYMTRQVHELALQTAGVHGHITSLNPIRPANAADPWEMLALESFEQGESEYASLETLDGEPYLRLMQPIITEQSCMKCHADQGYQVGDVRGGISVSVPMAPYLAIARQDITTTAVGHSVLWLLGLMALVFGARRIKWHVTESNQAEKALRESEEQHRLLIENMGDVISQHLADSTIIYISPSCENMLGFKPEELLNTRSVEVVHPQDIESTIAIINNAVSQHDDHYRLQHRIRHKDGRYIWVETVGKLAYGPDGSLCEIQCNVRNITERKQAKEAYKKSEQKYRDFFEKDVSGSYLSTPSGKLIDCNIAFTDMLGYGSRAELIGTNTSKLYPSPKDQQLFIAQLKEAENLVNSEIDLVKRDGRIIHCIENVVGVFDDAGELVQFQGYIIDITERKQAEEKLRASEGRLKALSEASFESIFISDKGVCLDQNRTAERTFGYTLDEAVGKHGTDWIALEDREHVKNAMLSDRKEPYEVTALRKDGTTFPAEIQARMIDHEGRNVRVTALRDITERKQAEEAVRESEHRYQELFSSVMEGICVVDENEIIKYCNPAFTEIFEEESANSLVGRNLLDYIPENQRAIILLETEKRRKGERSQYKIEISTAKGSKKTVFVSVTPRFDNNNFIGSFGSVLDITDRKQAEEKLRESESIYRSTIENASGVPYQLDLVNGKYIFVGVGIENLLGISQHEFSPQTYVEMILERDVTSPDSMGDHTTYNEAFRLGEVEQFRADICIKTPSGDIKWINDCSVPIHDDTEQVVGSLGILHDITERKLMEEAIRKSEERHRHLVESVQDIIYTISPEGIVTSLSPAFEAITGWAANEWVGKSFEQLMHPDEILGGRELFAEFFDGKEPYVHELRVLAKSGQYLNLEFQDTVIKRDGKAIEMLGCARDVTERKRMDKALRESEERFRAIFETAKDSIFIKDTSLKYTQVNPTMERLFELSTSELIGRTDDDLFGAEAGTHIKEVDNRVLSGETIEEEHTKPVRGVPITFHSIKLPMYDTTGKIIGLCGIARDITIRKQAEKAIRESEYRYQELFNSVMEGVVITDTNSIVKYCNPAYVEIFEEDSANSLIDKSILDYVPDSQLEIIRSESEIRQNGEGSQYEIEIGTAKGRKKIILVSAMPKHDSNGNFIGSFGSVLDITERKQAEKALREKERFHKALLDDMQTFVALLEPNGDVIFVNNTPLKVGGLELQDIIGKKFYDAPWWTHSDEVREAIINDIEHCNRGKSLTHDVQIQIADGSLMWIEYSMHPIYDDHGNIQYLVPEGRNITDRRQVEEALRESEEKFRTYISHAPDAIFIADSRGRYIDINEAACQITGYSRSELLSMSISDLVDPENPQEDLESFDRLKTIGQAHSEIHLKRKDGSYIWASLDAVALSEDRFMAFCSDITETKRLQKLESRAERLNMAGTIAGQVAHDFNNLLAPIIAYPEFIHDELPNGHAAHTYLDAIENAANRMAIINQDLLTMGRRGHYNQEIFDLNLVVRQAAQEMESRTKTVSVETDLCEELMSIKGGAAQIHRMLTNLLVNAQDAMEDIGQISIRTENYYADDTSIAYGRVPKGEYIKLTVSDNGCGIPDDIIQKILDPFFSTKTTDKKRGSGLGLSVVDAVMKDHGGYLDLSSKVGQGTSFYLYFPVDREDYRDVTSIDQGSGTETILVVDDDDIQRKVSSQLLKTLGYEVSSVESGKKAIKFLRKKAQDIIILDMVMPDGIDGTETYRQLLEINPDQKAIILSGFSESNRVLEAQELGAGDFVRKPVTKDTLAAAVRIELDRPVRTLAP